MNKLTVGFTIDKQVVEDFDKHCKNNCIVKSQIVEKLISKWLEIENRA